MCYIIMLPILLPILLELGHTATSVLGSPLQALHTVDIQFTLNWFDMMQSYSHSDIYLQSINAIVLN